MIVGWRLTAVFAIKPCRIENRAGSHRYFDPFAVMWCFVTDATECKDGREAQFRSAFRNAPKN